MHKITNRKIRFLNLLLVPLLLLGLRLSAEEPSYYVWIEGEDASRTTNMHPEGFFYKGLFSEELILKAPDSDTPAEGCFAEYDIEIPEDGTYTIWFHGNSQMTSSRSPCEWSIDEGPMQSRADYTSIPSAVPPDKRWLQKSCAWTKLGQVKLTRGKHKFLLKALPSQHYGRYVAYFDCIVFINEKYSTWKPDITPEPDGIKKPPLKPSKEGFNFFPRMSDGGHGILEVDFSRASEWTPVNMLLKREVSFSSLPKNVQILVAVVERKGPISLFVLFEDAKGEEFEMHLPGSIINRWGHSQINPTQLIEESNFNAQGGDGGWTVDLPLKFKGMRIKAHQPMKEKIKFDNLIVGGRLVEDFEDLSDWSVTTKAQIPEPVLYSISQQKEGWGRFFVQFDTIYLASDITSLVPFEYDADIAYIPTYVRLQLDLPKGIHIASKSISVPWETESVPAVKELGKAKHEGKEYTRYRVVCKSPFLGWTKLAGYPPLRLYLRTDLKAGSKTKIYHKTIWKHGEEKKEDKEIVKTVEILKVNGTTPPKRFMTGVWSPGFASDRPTPNDFYLKMGFVDLYGVPSYLIKELKSFGYRKVLPGSIGDLRWDLDKGVTYIDGQKLFHKGMMPYTGVPTTSSAGVCPTYRGNTVQEALRKSSDFAKQGYDGVMVTSGEIHWHDPKDDKRCFCNRCLEKYKEFMKKKYPKMKYISPSIFEKDWTEYPEYHKTWFDFKTDMFAERFRLYVDKFNEEAGASVRTESNFHGSRAGPGTLVVNRETRNYMNSRTGFPYCWSMDVDYRKIGKFIDVFAEQADSPPDITLTGDCVRAQREMLGDDARGKIVPLLACHYSIYFKRTGWKWDENFPDTYKYMMFECIANGAKGLGHLPEGTLDGWNQKEVVDVLNIVKTVEDVIMDGSLIPIEKFKSEEPLRIRGIGTGKEAVIMVANYTRKNKSKGDVNTRITFSDARPGQNVIDLETGEILGKFTAKEKSFLINIKQYKSRLLYIGPRKGVGLGKQSI